MMNYRSRDVTLLSAFPLLFLSLLPMAADTKLKPEELVARHLESLGSTEARSSRATNVAEGRVQVRFLVGGFGTQPGNALFFSKGNRYSLELNFQSQQYRGEKIVFDGKDFLVEFAVTTARSPFGDFLFTYDSVIKEGLLGSVLSTGWPMLSLGERKPRLRYEGLKKVDNQELHELDYRPRRGGGDVTTRLYFDPESFRHIKSVYRVKLAAGLGTSLSDAGQRETYYQLVETFDDFQSIEGLDIPKSWNIRFSIDGSQSLLWEWDIRLDKITPNHPVG